MSYKLVKKNILIEKIKTFKRYQNRVARKSATLNKINTNKRHGALSKK